MRGNPVFETAVAQAPDLAWSPERRAAFNAAYRGQRDFGLRPTDWALTAAWVAERDAR